MLSPSGCAVRRSAALARRRSRCSAPSRRCGSPLGAGDARRRWTPLVAAGFLLVAELAYWSLEPRVPALDRAWPARAGALVTVARRLRSGAGARGARRARGRRAARAAASRSSSSASSPPLSRARRRRRSSPARATSGRFAPMAQVLPAERDLRRVIGDGDGVPDGEVEGLSEQDLLELYRSLVAAAHLRRALGRLPPPGPDRHVRDLLEPRGDAGRLGVRARATRTGSSRATASRRSGCCAGCRPRRSSRGGAATRPAGGTRPTTTSPRSASRSRRTCRTPPGSPGARSCAASAACAIAYFGDGATSEGAFHEGANFAAVMRAPLVLFCNNNQWAISTPLSAQTARRDARRQGGRLRDARACASTAATCSPSTRRRARRSRGRAPARGRRSSRRSRTAPRRTRRPTTRRAYIDLERVEEEKQRECVGRYEALPAPAGLLSDELAEAIRAEAAGADARRDRRRRGRAAGRPGAVFEHALRRPARRRSRPTSPSCGGSSDG